MIICSCKAVSDHRILLEIDRGARSVGDLARRCGAGSDCGACAADLRDMVRTRKSILELDRLAIAAK